MRPETRYAKSSGGYVAYQVFGDGPRDILFVPSWSQNLDAMWDEPTLVRYFQRLSRAGRVICFDKRGSGVSDPVPLTNIPTLEEWMDDAVVAMDAAGSEQAAVIGDAEGGPMAMLLAATVPDRVIALALVNTFARWSRAPDYPIGMPEGAFERLMDLYEQTWGQNPDMLLLTAPSVADDPRIRDWFVRYQRLSMPPGAAAATYRWVSSLDVRAVLPTISAPTLVLHRTENRHYRLAFGRYLAEHIPGARLVELPGADCYPFHVGDSEAVLDEIHAFLTGVREGPPAERELATVLFTDIVGSTDLAAELGDARWLDLRDDHDAVLRRTIAAYRGQEVKTTGDGFLATFDGPARAVQCAVRAGEAVRSLGLEIRAGLHTGEIERRDGDIGGLAVHLAARVMGEAGAGDVLVSGTVRDLVVGSGIDFEDRGEHSLKGVPGTWRLLRVTGVP
ncbi:MAG TPA: adenylate/guanylate cyclase domain-containing protein [Actinomycetota bacterium]